MRCDLADVDDMVRQAVCGAFSLEHYLHIVVLYMYKVLYCTYTTQYGMACACACLSLYVEVSPLPVRDLVIWKADLES